MYYLQVAMLAVMIVVFLFVSIVACSMLAEGNLR